MTIVNVLKLLEIIVWPLVTLLALMLVRPSLTALLSGAKVRLSIAGQVIETTLPELQRIFEEQASEPLTSQHVLYLRALRTDGGKGYPDGVQDSDEREFLRVLRNTGLIQLHPRGSRLRKATTIELSGLGRLYLQATGR